MEVNDKFVLRAPLYSVDKLTIANDIDQIIRNLDFLKAIFIASPTLYQAIEKYKSKSVFSPKEYNRLKTSIIRYYTRMCSRATPFGLFSGYAIGNFGTQTKIIVSGKKETHTYLEITLLNRIINKLIDKYHLKESLLLYSNSSLLQTEEKVRYIEIGNMDLCKGYSYAEIDNNEIIHDIIEKGKTGIRWNELIDYLLKYEFEKEEIEEYVNEIIANQILIPEWQLSVSNTSLLDKIYEAVQQIKDPLVEIITYFLKKQKHEKDISFREIEEISKLIASTENIQFNPYTKSPYNITCKLLPESISLDKKIKETIREGIEFLSIVTPPYINNRLKSFQEKFYKRYEERPVPLLEAIDPVIGIGYPNASILRNENRIIDKLTFDNEKESNDMLFDKKITQLLLNKIKENKQEILLTPEDIRDIVSTNHFATCMTVFTEIVYESETDRVLVFFKSVSGHSSTYALSRFGWGDEEMLSLLKELSEKDKANNVENEIEAEIIHMPEDTEGNVILRPVTRNRVILCNANDRDPSKETLHLSDLQLKMVNQELKLIRKDTGEIILPYNSTAHNYSISKHPVYMLLSDLQFNNYANSMYLDVSILLNFYDHIPRISYFNCIFSLETWRIQTETLQELVREKRENEILNKIRKWRKSLNIPPRVIFIEGDNTLLIDFERIESIHMLLSLNPKNKILEIKEFLYDSCRSITTDTENHPFTNEFIFAITDNNK